MRLIDLIIDGDLKQAKDIFEQMLEEKLKIKLAEEKEKLKTEMFDDDLVEAVKRNANIIKMGRINKIRRRVRRNAKGRIVVQKNRRRSGIKGYKISGNTVKRIPAIDRIRKARLLKRSWKTTRRAKLRRSLLKRKMSMRRRSTLGLK